MFPLKEKKIGGFTFGQIYPKSFGTLAGHKHLGVDYRAVTGTPLYAPFGGQITNTLIGVEGGKTIWFKPENDNVIMRFMHLLNIGCNKGDWVQEGKFIGLTGNTGSATTGAHLHLDISKKSVDIYTFANFLDPEKYQWIYADLGTPIDTEPTQEIDQPVIIPAEPSTTPETPETLTVPPNLKPQSEPVTYETLSDPKNQLWQAISDILDWLIQIFNNLFNKK